MIGKILACVLLAGMWGGVCLAQGGHGNPIQVKYKNVANIQVTGVSWEDAGTGVVSFTFTDSSAKFVDVENMKPTDFEIKVGNVVAPDTCKGFVDMSSNQPVDVVLAVDRSGSMSTMQTSLKKSIPELMKTIEARYNARFAEVQFGGNESENGVFVDFNEFDSLSVFANGNIEKYYKILDSIAKYPFSYKPLSQKIIIMIGDEGVKGDLLNNPPVFKLTKDSVAKKLRQNGFQTFIVNQPRNITDFEAICSATNGKFITAESNGQFSSDLIVNGIGESLKHRMFLRFCLPRGSEPACDTTVQLSVSIRGTGKTGETESRLKYLPELTRDAKSVRYDRKDLVVCADSVLFGGEIRNNCTQDAAEVTLHYRQAGAGVEWARQEAAEAGYASWQAEIPAGNFNSGEIEYYVTARNSWSQVRLPAEQDSVYRVSVGCHSFEDCGSVDLSFQSEPIREGADTLSYRMSEPGLLFFAIMDGNGRLVRKTVKDYRGERFRAEVKTESLQALFKGGLSLETGKQYTLVASDGRHVLSTKFRVRE